MVASGLIDLDRFPIHARGTRAYDELMIHARAGLAEEGMFNLDGFLRPEACAAMLAETQSRFETNGFRHRRRHNIYFGSVDGLPSNHPVLTTDAETANHTLAADVAGGLLRELYEYPPLAAFLAEAMDTPGLHVMDDPLARINVMRYRNGEALGWHFDRSEFTTTLLLQAPTAGGAFEYRTALRSDDEPNYDGVARLLRGDDAEVRAFNPASGTLNVFRGKNTAHRVTQVEGSHDRIIAVFSYYERSGVVLSEAERIGFYGRAS